MEFLAVLKHRGLPPASRAGIQAELVERNFQVGAKPVRESFRLDPRAVHIGAVAGDGAGNGDFTDLKLR